MGEPRQERVIALETVALLTERVHQTFRQADLRLLLIWQASYFPALFSSLLVCSPLFILGCGGLPVVLSLPIPPSLSLIPGTFF